MLTWTEKTVAVSALKPYEVKPLPLVLIENSAKMRNTSRYQRTGASNHKRKELVMATNIITPPKDSLQASLESFNRIYDYRELCDLKPAPTGNSIGLRKMNPENMRIRAIRLFWAKVDKSGENDCWLWNSRLIGKGYGAASYCGHDVLAHRLSFYLANGYLPKDLCVCHECDNPRCVNPKHLFLGTLIDNNEDMKKKNRHAFGERNGAAKLTKEQVEAIKKETGTQREIAEKYNVGQCTISDIKSGKRWRNAA